METAGVSRTSPLCLSILSLSWGAVSIREFSWRIWQVPIWMESMVSIKEKGTFLVNNPLTSSLLFSLFYLTRRRSCKVWSLSEATPPLCRGQGGRDRKPDANVNPTDPPLKLDAPCAEIMYTMVGSHRRESSNSGSLVYFNIVTGVEVNTFRRGLEQRTTMSW